MDIETIRAKRAEKVQQLQDAMRNRDAIERALENAERQIDRLTGAIAAYDELIKTEEPKEVNDGTNN